jgi:hypothetical protein
MTFNKYQDQNNVHPPETAPSGYMPWGGFPSTNWSASVGQCFSVTLDPQIDAGRSISLTAQSGATAIEQLTREFSDWNDDLLSELAR